MVKTTGAEPTYAFEAILKVAVMEVGLTTATLLNVSPDQAGADNKASKSACESAQKLFPVIVTLTLVPRCPVLGDMEVNCTAAAGVTVMEAFGAAEKSTYGKPMF